MLSKFFISRPKFALVISLIASLVGVIAIYLIPIAEYPDVTPPQVVVTANYPGADAGLIEKTVAIPIEEQVNGVENMLFMSSTSSNAGSYQLTITFEVGTDPDIAAVNVQNRVSLGPAAASSFGHAAGRVDEESSRPTCFLSSTSCRLTRAAMRFS